jgi:uncharacterized damage-inducible protein DinB
VNSDEIKLLYEYNFWANHRILNTCAQVSPEKYAASASPQGVGYESLRATLLHILGSERGWRLICQGVPDVDWDELNEADYPTLQSLAGRWQAEEDEMQAYIGSLTDDDLQGIVRYPIDNGIVRERALWHCLYHLVNHGTQHRSEAAALLTSYGQSPGDFDFTLFLNDYFKLPS